MAINQPNLRDVKNKVIKLFQHIIKLIHQTVMSPSQGGQLQQIEGFRKKIKKQIKMTKICHRTIRKGKS